MKIFIRVLVATGLLALVTGPALAYEPGTFVLRGGVGTVAPKSHSLTISDEVETVVIDVENGTSMTLTGTYMFNEHLAIDVLAALPFKHDIKATIDMGEGPQTAKIASTKQLPPTVSLQYHFSPDSDFQPYVGLGINWTNFSDTKLASIPGEGNGEVDEDLVDLKLDNSTGIAAQFGGDWAIGDNAVVNFDIRYMDIDSDVNVKFFGMDEFEKIGTAKIDPWIYSINLGYRF
jgi:outer membrane protein